MRFITEFESTYGGESQQRYIEKMPYWEERGAAELCTMIGKAFGWKQKEVLSETRHILEIEAFPMDKWIEFKKRFMDALPDYDSVSRSRLINAIAELEQSPHTDVNEIKKR
jgi:hypothetical protein